MDARPKRGGREPGRIAAAAVLSLVAHALLFVYVLLFNPGALLLHGPATPKVNPVGLINLPQKQWAKNRLVSPNGPKVATAPQKPTEEQKPPEPEPMPKGQVVATPRGNDEMPLERAPLMAEHNNRVEKQTRAKDQTAVYKNAMPRQTTTVSPKEPKGQDNVEKEVIAGNSRAQDEGPDKGGKKGKIIELPAIQAQDELALKGDGAGGQFANRKESEAVRGNSDRLRIRQGEPGAEGDDKSSSGRQGTGDLHTLLPSTAVLDKITGSAPNDHLPDVEEGDGTYLNTRSWLYSSFFNRVKQGVGMAWNPFAALRRRDPSGQIYGWKDRETQLSVTLDEKGTLKDIYVERSCGLDFLDREAIAAFEKAQPFSNPPRAMLDDRKEVRFEFGFFVELGDSGIQLYRRF